MKIWLLFIVAKGRVSITLGWVPHAGTNQLRQKCSTHGYCACIEL